MRKTGNPLARSFRPRGRAKDLKRGRFATAVPALNDAYFARDFFTSSAETERAVLRSSASSSSTSAIPSRSWIVSRCGVPFLQADDREPPHGDVRVARRELVEQRAERVDVAGMRPREALERDERRAARGRALVLEPAAQQLELLAEAELRDRAVRLRAHAVVGVARARLDLLVPLRAKLRERALVTGLREGVRLGSRLGERHAD